MGRATLEIRRLKRMMTGWCHVQKLGLLVCNPRSSALKMMSAYTYLEVSNNIGDLERANSVPSRFLKLEFSNALSNYSKTLRCALHRLIIAYIFHSSHRLA